MKLLDRILSIKPPEILYHYASPGGLYGIITNKSLWTTNIHYFNDSSEFSYAINIAKNLLTYDSRLKIEPEFIKMINSHMSSISKVQKFVFSLSECGDLLSQWRGYCPTTGGYSLGFDPNKLSEIASKNHEFYLYPCQYDRSIQEALIREVLTEAFENYQVVKQNFSTPEDISRMCWGQFTSKFGVVAAIVKDPSWSEEKEWRLASHPLPITHPNFKMRVGKYNLIPYLELALGDTPEQWPFKNVIVGPNLHQELALNSVSSLLFINKIKYGSITCSRIPFRDC